MAEVTINWVDMNYGEASHEVYRATSPMDPQNLPAPIATLGTGVQEYVDSSAPDETLLYYRVSATDAGGEVYVSDEIQIDTTPAYPLNAQVYFTFDNLSGSTVIDKMGNYNATINGDVDIVPGFDGNSADFPGSTSSYIDFGSSLLTASTEFTISLWAKMTSYGHMISKGTTTLSDGFIFFRKVDGQEDFRLRDGGVISDGVSFLSNIRDGNWHHLVAVYSPDGQKLYFDGQLDNSTTEYLGELNVTGDWRMGRDPRTQDPYSGELDNVRIYDFALTDQEIFELYLAQA